MQSWISKSPFILTFLIVIHSGMLAYNASQASPTMNEPAHLAAGICHWKFGRFEPYRVNPPLVRLVAAVPLNFIDHEEVWTNFYDAPGARPVFSMGQDFVEANGNRTFELITYARWFCIPFSILGLIFSYYAASKIHSKSGGIVSAVLWTFSPMMLGHGALITSDCAAASSGIIAAYVFSKFLREPTINNSLLSGCALSFALLTKFTWTILLVLWPLFFVLIVWMRWADYKECKSKIIRVALMMSCIYLIAFYILHLSYGFQEKPQKLKEFHFVSNLFSDANSSNRFSESFIGEMIVPFPNSYITGIDVQRKDFEDFGHPAYLRGEWEASGWWYYYLYGFLVKTPLPTLIFFASTLIFYKPFSSMLIDSPENFLCFVVTPMIITILISSQTGINHHYRYFLPVLAFVFVMSGASPIAVHTKTVTILLLSYLGLVSFFQLPHSLSYFNEFVGDQDGHRHLIHSSLDWGQDLKHLEHWVTQNQDARPLYVAYYGSNSFSDFGVSGEEFKKSRIDETTFKKGWYAISVNFVVGERFSAPPGADSRWMNLEPTKIIGKSIWIYYLKSDTQIPPPTLTE